MVQAQQQRGQSELHWVRFVSLDKKRPYILEARLVMTVVAGPPAVWSMCLPEGSTQPGSTQGETIPCNSWFCVEIEVGDAYLNR